VHDAFKRPHMNRQNALKQKTTPRCSKPAPSFVLQALISGLLRYSLGAPGSSCPPLPEAIEQATRSGDAGLHPVAISSGAVYLCPAIRPSSRRAWSGRSCCCRGVAKPGDASVPCNLQRGRDPTRGRGCEHRSPCNPSNWTMWLIASPLKSLP